MLRAEAFWTVVAFSRHFSHGSPKIEYCQVTRLAGFSPSPPMQKHREICAIGACGQPSRGKQYCAKHMTAAQRRTLTSELSGLIRSDCCSAKCVIGKVHDNGEQYCEKC